MKIIYRIAVLFIIISISNRTKAYSQEDVVFHFAYMADKANKVLYVSNIAVVVFMEYFNYETDALLPSEMERQFMEYVEFKYDIIILDDNDFAYKMGEDELEVEDAYYKVVDTYKEKGFKIKKVKGFCYD